MARQDANETLLQTAFLYGANAGYIEDLYARYTKDPRSVDAQWQAFYFSNAKYPLKSIKLNGTPLQRNEFQVGGD